ncbi:hypothetical protein VNO78_06973 [Psophocarpus tetragonolobus]|uniref:Uncharacterized protein n=1 Tax=Psophocarpus tetragonolobus TaxID=3891 RepID=A0AAN9SVR1_PSOTE
MLKILQSLILEKHTPLLQSHPCGGHIVAAPARVEVTLRFCVFMSTFASAFVSASVNSLRIRFFLCVRFVFLLLSGYRSRRKSIFSSLSESESESESVEDMPEMKGNFAAKMESELENRNGESRDKLLGQICD